MQRVGCGMFTATVLGLCRVVRMAVRYINRLDLPGPGVDLKEYLKTWPEASADLAQPLASFLMQLDDPAE